MLLQLNLSNSIGHFPFKIFGKKSQILMSVNCNTLTEKIGWTPTCDPRELLKMPVPLW